MSEKESKIALFLYDTFYFSTLKYYFVFQCRTKYKVQVRLKDFPGMYARLEYMIDKKAIRLPAAIK